MRRPDWVRIASWAVMNASGTAAAGLVERVRHRGHAALVHDDAVGEAAAADQAEDAVAGLPAEHLCTAGLDRAGDLEAGNVLRASRRGGIEPGPLRQVGRVEAGVPNVDDDLLGAWKWIRTVLDANDVVPSGSGEYNSSHRARSSSTSATIPSASSR